MIDWPEQLITDLGRRRVIVMIGSGVSRHSVGACSAKPPTWRAFLEDALGKCNPAPSHIRAAISRGQYLDACDWLKRCLDEKWGASLRQSFLTPKFRPAEIHGLIYQLDARVVLTPNFDKIYDNYAAAESEGTVVIKKYYDNDIIDFLRRGDRIVLKAHGTIDEYGRMIFTKAQYAKARIDYSAFYSLLDSLMSTNTILMLGVGLDDPDFQLLFEDHASRYRSDLPHYMTFGGAPNDDIARTVRETRNIKLLPYSPKSEHVALVKSLEELVAKVTDKRTELARTGDW